MRGPCCNGMQTRPRDIPGASCGLRLALVLVAEGDPSAAEVVWRDLDRDPVSSKHPNPEAPHLPRDRREHIVPVRQENTKGGVWQYLRHRAFQLDSVLLRHQRPCFSVLLRRRAALALSCRASLGFT